MALFFSIVSDSRDFVKCGLSYFRFFITYLLLTILMMKSQYLKSFIIGENIWDKKYQFWERGRNYVVLYSVGRNDIIRLNAQKAPPPPQPPVSELQKILIYNFFYKKEFFVLTDVQLSYMEKSIEGGKLFFFSIPINIKN